MKRNLVQIARIRMEEVVPGDVVNRVPDDTRGWFIVAALEPLFDGTLQVTDAGRHHAFSAGPLDIVGVQLLKPIELEVTADPGTLHDALGGTHDSAIDSAASRDAADADADAESAHADADAESAHAEPRLPVPHALTAPSAPTEAASPLPPDSGPRPAERPAERRTMRSLVEP